MTTSALRQVRFPLRFKLLALIIILITSALSFYVSIALKTFKEDKSAYIFETLLNKASTEEIILSQKLNSLNTSGEVSLRGNKLFYNEQDITPLVQESFQDENNFDLKIIIPSQGEFLEWDKEGARLVTKDEKIALSPIFKNSIHEAVQEISLNAKKWLYAYHYNPKLNYILVSMMPEEKAFEVTSYLVNKSLYYGMFVLGIAILISVLLARPLTAQLETLFGMTQEISKGNFNQRVAIKGHDEVGALSDSVNDMADKIVVYMEEMKEKARLENEVEVAKLVQSSFFPHSNSDSEVFGHFEPATECGGDWWGIFYQGDWKILFIADATGHGVPAALLTATMNCCKSSLSFIFETRPEIVSQPNEILRYMNQAVSEAGKEIQVTCFVACYNQQTKEISYSNSSHNPPLLFNSSVGELSKEHFQTLNEANGPRLGQKANSTYTYSKIKLSKGDTLFFYTDGIIEAENSENARWGERRLIKSLIKNGTGSSQDIVNSVVKEFKDFIENTPLNDDFTAVAMKVNV